MNHDEAIDLSGLCCAEPIIRITRQMKAMNSGQVLLVISDKSSMSNDIPAYCRQTGNSLAFQDETQGQLKFWIRKD